MMKNLSFVKENSWESDISVPHTKASEMCKANVSPVNLLLQKVLSHSLHFNHSYQALVANAKLINSTPGTKIHIPATIYRIKKMVLPQVPTEFYIHCNICKEYLMTKTAETECVSCLQILNRAQSKYFVNLPLKPQLLQSINDHFDDIISYCQSEKFDNDVTIIYDMQNSIQYKNAKEKFPDAIILPLALNTDGARLFNSTNKSIWPLQVIQNFLKPTIRYVPENIIVAAIYEGKKYIRKKVWRLKSVVILLCLLTGKPDDMKNFFYPMLRELNDIYNEGGIFVENHGKTYCFLPLILQCSVDLPAKKDVQNMIGPNGYFGCAYCLQKGDLVRAHKNAKSHVRFVREENVSIRTHENLLNIYAKQKSLPMQGVTGISCLIAAEQFDLINGFSIDYMHCVLLGTMRKLLDLWLNPKNHKEQFYINKKKQEVLNYRLLQIKPNTEITRKPRSINDRGDYKANELRSLLLYYLRYSLPGLLPQRYIKHFQLLSAAIYMLLEESISLENISLAEKKLVEFADQHEELYGKENITMNLHLLRHMARSVQELGPLWAQSTFAFETNNGTLVHSRQAKSHCLQQMAWKYSTKKYLERTKEKYSERKGSPVLYGRKATIKIEPDDMEIFAASGFHVPNDKFTILYNITFRGIKLTSKKSRIVSIIDYFIESRSNEIGAVSYYFACADGTFVFLEIYALECKTDHLIVIKPTSIRKVINVKEIAHKLMYLKIKDKEIVTKIPNHYEKT